MLDFMTIAGSSTLLALADLKTGEDGWAGSVNFTASSASGNTDNTVLGGRFSALRKYGALTNAIEAGGNYAEATSQVDGDDVVNITQNRWFVQYRLDVQTGEKTFVYGRTRYDEDQFSGFDRQWFIGGGLGHSLFKDDRKELSFLVGPGYQYFERSRPDPQPEDFVRTERNVAVFVGQTYRHVLRENVTVEQGLDATISEQNTSVASTMSLKTDLTDHLSSRISYNVTHNTEPPEGREKTDTLLSASIGYDF